MIVVEPQRVFLVGNELFRTYWAVGEFLRRYLDVRWLRPGEVGEDILEKARVVIPPQRIIEEPAILARTWAG